ncbi:MAG TPA: metallophosphoesterase [Spirochaetota bacterium]|nr:metallophosphoesterase [Spirochaetota bacterium]
MREKVSLYLYRIVLLFILSGICSAGCSAAKPVTESVRFAIIGNTSPDSPFSGFTKYLPASLDEIESRKPQIIIHTGDALYGGSTADGILESDLRRQLNIFFPMLKSLNTAVYTIPGEKDYYNGSITLYSEFTGRKPAYSFNYGSIHFICLSSSDSAESFIDDEQLEWLKNDLREFSDSNAIFIFAHHQLFQDKKKGKIPESKEDLHKLFLEHKVKAVFSGSEKEYSTKLKDSIKYINTGCSGTPDKKESRKSYRFYMINFINNEINIDPVK